MKRIAALLAVVMFATLFGGVAVAQDNYPPSPPPNHTGLAADGSLALDFSNTEFATGSAVTITNKAGQALATGTIGTDGLLIVADASALEGQSVIIQGVRTDGGAIVSGVKFVPAVEPTPVPPVVPTSVAPPAHVGLADDGSLMLDFGPTDFAVGSKVIVNDAAGNALASITVGADGKVVIPDATGIAGQSLQFVGVNGAGAAVTSALKFLSAPAPTPAPVPTQAPVIVQVPVPVPVVVQPAAPVVTGPAGSFDPKLAVTPQRIIDQADADAKAPAPAPSGPAVPLAVTGGNAQIPVMIGSALILAGGLTILASRKRAEAI